MSTLEALLADELALEQTWQGGFMAMLDDMDDRRAVRKSKPRRDMLSVSPSFVVEAMKCPEKLRRKYGLGEREPWGGTAIIGLAVHRAAELNYAQKVQTGRYMSVADVKELAADSFDVKLAEAEEDGVDWQSTNHGEALDLSINLSALYHEKVATKVEPVAVEEWYEVGLLGIPAILRGRVDVRTADRVVDVKTTKGKPGGGKPRPEWRTRAVLYNAMTGLDFEWHAVTRAATPAVWTANELPGLRLPARAGQLATMLLARVGRDVGALYERHGLDEPWDTAAIGSEFYSGTTCDMCGFRDTCAHWAWER